MARLEPVRTEADTASLVRSGVRLVSTDYVIDESCTLAKARAGPAAAIQLLDLRRSDHRW